jgi:hypothetical protein
MRPGAARRAGLFAGRGGAMAKAEKGLELAGGKVPRLRKPQRKSFGKARQERFLAALAATCNVRAACRTARVSNTCVYAHRRKNAAFRAGWAEAVREAYGRLELATLERMMNGTVTTRTRADGSVDRTHEYPNAIALQLLRLHRQSAAEAQAEHDSVDMDEVRERIALRIERLRKRMERDGAGEAEGA